MSPTTQLPAYSENYNHAEKAHGVYIPPAVPADPSQPPSAYTPPQTDNETEKRRKRKRLIWILVGVLALLIIIGAVLGGVFGSGITKKKSDSSSSSEGASSTSSATPSGSTSPAKRIGLHAATLDGATANSMFYASDSDGNIILRYLDHGKASDNPSRSKPNMIYNVSTPGILLDRKPLKNTPLAICELTKVCS